MERLKTPGVFRRLWLPALFVLLLAGKAPGQASLHERAIAEAYAEWVETVNAKDLDAWASFLAPGAVFFPPGSPALSNRQAILKHYAALFADDQFSLNCHQQHVEVSESEDLAWAYGGCQATFTGPDGQIAHGSSKWMKVWRRQSDGAWKCAANSWNSTVAE